MFQVLPDTARNLYRSQSPGLRGKLRLDISSRHYPKDPTVPLDVPAAREAIGERLVRLLQGCAVDAALLAEQISTPEQVVKSSGNVTQSVRDSQPPDPDSIRSRFEANSVPFLDRDDDQLLVMANRYTFEPHVVHRIKQLFGLDPDSKDYEQSIGSLACEFHDWVNTDDTEAFHGFTREGSKIFVVCYLLPLDIQDNEQAEDFSISLGSGHDSANGSDSPDEETTPRAMEIDQGGEDEEFRSGFATQ